METWILQKEFKFEASHILPNHDGKCGRLHGHSWVGRLHVVGYKLIDTGPKGGMLIDYSDLKKAIQPLLDDKLDHWHLNDSTGLVNPTSEELARWIWYYVSKDPTVGPYLGAVEINETCTSRCIYNGPY